MYDHSRRPTRSITPWRSSFFAVAMATTMVTINGTAERRLARPTKSNAPQHSSVRLARRAFRAGIGIPRSPEYAVALSRWLTFPPPRRDELEAERQTHDEQRKPLKLVDAVISPRRRTNRVCTRSSLCGRVIAGSTPSTPPRLSRAQRVFCLGRPAGTCKVAPRLFTFISRRPRKKRPPQRQGAKPVGRASVGRDVVNMRKHQGVLRRQGGIKSENECTSHRRCHRWNEFGSDRVFR